MGPFVPRLPHVDTHCHIDLYERPIETLLEAERQGVSVVAMTNLPSAFRTTEHLVARSAASHASLGLHPGEAARAEVELASFREEIARTRFVGEVGLDGSVGDQSSRDVQVSVFREVLRACRDFGLRIVSVHSRRAAGQVVEQIGPAFNGAVILHWFSGTDSQARKALSYGFYFSVNLAMAASRAGGELVRWLPRDRVLTESDGPFVKVRNRASGPKDVIEAVRWIAEQWDIPVDEARQQISRNFLRCTDLVETA